MFIDINISIILSGRLLAIIYGSIYVKNICIIVLIIGVIVMYSWARMI